jgi:hypothetical protein
MRIGSSIVAGEILDQLAVLLRGSTLKVSQEQDSLVVTHDHYSTRVELAVPDRADLSLGRIEAVVQIRTDLPDEMAQMITEERGAVLNQVASLGALTFDGERIFIGSRLTIQEADNAWNIQAPMLLVSIIGAADSIISGFNKSMTEEASESAECAWKKQDFQQVERISSRRSVCSTGRNGFTAEFGLQPGAVSAMAGDWNSTALWKMRVDQPHPSLGGGLFCLLQLPHRLADASHLAVVLRQLNQLEMRPHPTPPHFGAWCVGNVGHNPAYVSFLPNDLHDAAPGIAANMTAWAWGRAQWANTTLASLGISLEPPKDSENSSERTPAKKPAQSFEEQLKSMPHLTLSSDPPGTGFSVSGISMPPKAPKKDKGADD